MIDFIHEKQKEHECYWMQEMVTNGAAWFMEGSIGRVAMAGLTTGEFFLPEVGCRDFYGNYVPSRDELEPGSKGTLDNAYQYWSEVIETI